MAGILTFPHFGGGNKERQHSPYYTNSIRVLRHLVRRTAKEAGKEHEFHKKCCAKKELYADCAKPVQLFLIWYIK